MRPFEPGILSPGAVMSKGSRARGARDAAREGLSLLTVRGVLMLFTVKAP